MDADCIANRSAFYQELFPTWPHYFENVQQEDGSFRTEYLDAHYYYRYIRFFDYTYDIYAEWPLKKAEFDAEVARVKVLYDRKSEYTVIQKGTHTCLILHDAELFEEVEDSYYYFIFAYDEQNLRVRYIYCDSLENGADQPYYLQLDW